MTFATQHRRNAAGRHFKIDQTIIGRWIKASKTWTSKINDKSMRVGSGRKAFYPEAEKELYDWILDQRKKRLAVTFVTIRISINEILDRADMVALYGDLITEFKATTGWLNAFMKRHNLIRYQRTKISQKLPKQLEEKLEEFYRFVIHLGIQKSFELCNILNMDKIPVWFDMARNFTINTKREKTVHICGIDNENNQFTVVLTCAADGTRLPPICIFKGKQMPRGEKAPPSVVVWVQENRWMNIELMKCYINYLNCMRSSNSQSRFPAMMVFDSFRGHLEELVKEKFK